MSPREDRQLWFELKIFLYKQRFPNVLSMRDFYYVPNSKHFWHRSHASVYFPLFLKV